MMAITEEELARETLVVACTTLELVRARAGVAKDIGLVDIERAERNVDNAARLLVGVLDD